ncbi:MAG: hypothetical protein A3I29_02820 [Candidatus Magasanikbacteria bacterium RIFCSPLOWO2_02_FULL_44_11]|uniref:Uncharacterized protein n=1 Tax=Candidatus Magasanikbacteria bacterium RIFCSPLOWO2_02_FULL_44_11 TaxID=1798689 RepID=A0A1F6N9M3_9BACT|nr:MAG: hypothetical protein A3I29_02820 [Candidatus Magasanikbacteria bacterium RIFCSPLOWO2_02_FULL_44_11]
MLNSRERALALYHAALHLYGFVAELGENLFMQEYILCRDEEEAAQIASARLVISLEKNDLLARIAGVMALPSR